MSKLPNPFLTDSALAPAMAAEAATAPDLSDPPVAVAEPFPRGFDPAKFLEDIEPLPIFLSGPHREHMRAVEIRPILETLAAHWA